MEEKNTTGSGKNRGGGKKPPERSSPSRGKRGLVAGFLVVIIALLVLAVVFLATPLKEMVQSQNNSGVAREDTSESKPTTVEPVEGAGESNNLPVINELLVSEGTIFTNAVVGLKAVALDPDGDSLIYTWHVSSGTLNSAHANPAEWTVPATPGNYSAKCVVDDEKGGIASDILIISVVEREDFTGSDIVLVPFETDPPEPDRESGIISILFLQICRLLVEKVAL